MRYFQRYEAFLVAFDRGTKGKRKGKGRKEEREEGKKGGEIDPDYWPRPGSGRSVIFRKTGYKEWEKGERGERRKKKEKGGEKRGRKGGGKGKEKGGRH